MAPRDPPPAEESPDLAEDSCPDECCDQECVVEYRIGECLPDGEGGCQRSRAGGKACCSPVASSAGPCCADAVDGHTGCLRELKEPCKDDCCKDDNAVDDREGDCCEDDCYKDDCCKDDNEVDCCEDDCCKDNCCTSEGIDDRLDTCCRLPTNAAADTCCSIDKSALNTPIGAKCNNEYSSYSAKEDNCPAVASASGVRRRIVRIANENIGKTRPCTPSSRSKATDSHPVSHVHAHRDSHHHHGTGRCGIENTFSRFFEVACCCLVDWRRATRHHRSGKRTTRTVSPPFTSDRRPLNSAQAEQGGGRKLVMVMSVQGMDCPSCARKVTRALLTVQSVSDVKVNSFAAQATLAYTEGLVFPADIARRATELTGFTCAVLEEVQASGEHRAMRIGMRAQSDIIWDKADLPSTVCVRSVLTSATETVLDVEYDVHLIKPRDVLAAFKAWNGVFVPTPRPAASEQAQKELISLFKRTAISAILCIPILVFSWAPLTPHPVTYGACSLAFTTAIQFYVAAPIFSSALRSLFLQRMFDMDLLIVLSTSVAYTFSVVAYFMLVAGHKFSDAFFETPALLITLIIFGRLISAYARRRATSALVQVQSLQTDTVELIDEPSSTVSIIHPDLVHVGDLLRVQADTLIPTDGTIVFGHSQVDESSITGESVPVEKASGSPLTAGTLNGSGVLHMRVERVPADNTVADIGRLLAQVQDARLPVQDLADRVAGYLAPTILIVASIVFATWIAVGITVRNQSSREAGVAALRYAVAVMVISCPCALVLCVPMVVVISAGVAGKNGVLFKSIEAVQYAKDVEAAVFDKTGTLTTGTLRVAQAHVVRKDKLNTVYALASSSRHPVSQAVAAHLLDACRTGPVTGLRDIESIPGCGMAARDGDTSLRGGSPSWLGIESHPAVIDMQSQALTMFAVVSGSETLAVFGLSDTPRASAVEAVKLLRSQGCEIYIVSGDSQPVVSSLAAQLEVPMSHAFGGCLPQTKLERVRELQAKKRKVMFIGDGTNDSLALAQADVGVSLGSGTDLALSTADVVLLDPERSTTDLARALRVLFGVSRAAVRRITINFIWAFVYNLFAVLLAAGAFVKATIAPQWAGLGEMVSIVPVVLVAWSMWLAKW